jgi:hypothetical protein
MKKCTKCGQEKDFKMFHKDKHNPDGFTYACKECRNNAYNEYYKKNPEKQKEKNNSQKSNRKKYYSSVEGIKSSRRSHLKRMFNISLEDYNELLERQNFKCVICNGYETSYRNEVLSVDHCHNTGKIRGLLCNTCNRALGLFKDNKELLTNAIKYLEQNE